MHKIITLLIVSLSCSSHHAQNIPGDTLNGNSLPEVKISGLHINDSLMNAPASVSVLSSKDLVRSNYINIAPALNTLAGVQMQSGAINTNRISIRGIGARTPFGTNKIRAFYGNIPLTSGDSETTIEDLNTENIRQVEIIKGPLSSLYGAGLGGAILLEPSIRKSVGSEAGISTTYGSFGMLKTSVNFNVNSLTSGMNVNYHKIESEGWRQNSKYDREAFTIAGELFRKADRKITYLANYTWMKAFIPSSINQATFENNPIAAAPTWLASKGYEQYKSYLIGLGYDFKIRSVKNSTSIFLNVKNSNEPRPFDILNQNTHGWGARTHFSGGFDFLKLKTNVIFGLEYFQDGFVGKTFENGYADNSNLGSLQGEQLSGSEQKRNFYNAFSQLRFQLSDKWEVQGGLNINKTQFELENIFPADVRSSEKYSYDAIWSPQVSLLFKPGALSTLYLSASRGFSLPSVKETLTANGTINSEIRPENGYNFEFGGKFYFFNRHFYADFALYRMQIKDLLVAQRIADDQYVGVNAGKTLHQGFEVSMNYTMKATENLSFHPYITASVGSYEFEEFLDNDENFSGNELPGVPKNKL
ncbi:MAG TPA: TonB-dependent receptor, partial [Chryseolinea sp.]|nr:TonB-dependent receptor [Chryseolinea sp.]